MKTRKLPGERDNARNDARYTHGLDGQHQDVDDTPRGLPVEESIRMIKDIDRLRKYVHGVANARIEDGYRTEQITVSSVQQILVGPSRE